MEPRNEEESRRNEGWARQIEQLHADLDPFEVTLDARPTGVPTEQRYIAPRPRPRWLEWAVAGLLSFVVGFAGMLVAMTLLRT